MPKRENHIAFVLDGYLLSFFGFHTARLMLRKERPWKVPLLRMNGSLEVKETSCWAVLEIV